MCFQKCPLGGFLRCSLLCSTLEVDINWGGKGVSGGLGGTLRLTPNWVAMSYVNALHMMKNNQLYVLCTGYVLYMGCERRLELGYESKNIFLRKSIFSLVTNSRQLYKCRAVVDNVCSCWHSDHIFISMRSDGYALRLSLIWPLKSRDDLRNKLPSEWCSY